MSKHHYKPVKYCNQFNQSINQSRQEPKKSQTVLPEFWLFPGVDGLFFMTDPSMEVLLLPITTQSDGWAEINPAKNIYASVKKSAGLKSTR